MSGFWKMIIELAVRLFFKWLEDEKDEKKRLETAGKAGAVAKAFIEKYNSA